MGIVKNCYIPLDAKNNDIRPCMGALAFLKDVDFRVRKIASSRKEYTEAVEVYLDGVKNDLGGHKCWHSL